MTRPVQALSELDAQSAEAVRLAEEYATKLTTLERNRFCPPPSVVPDGDGFRVHLPGRVPGTVAQLAVLFSTKREAEQALRRFQGGGHRD